MKSPPSSPTFWMSPYCGVLGLLLATGISTLWKSWLAERYSSSFFCSLSDRNLRKTLLLGTVFSTPLVMAFLLGTAPNVANPKVLLGTSAALGIAFSGFATTALALVAAALFLAAAMQVTGLDRRIALVILSRVGTETRSVLAGSMLVGIVLAFLVPSTTARVSCLVPIMLGIIAGTTESEGFVRVEADVPLAEMFGYSTVLRSATQGTAEYTMEFAKYAPVPAEIADELIKQFGERKEG